MTAAIIQALGGLNDVIDRLEQNMTRREKMPPAPAARKKTAQADLFSAPQPSQQTGRVVALDSALLAKKLDVAISRVEELLKEG